MKILVCLKQVPHSDARLDVAGDGKWISEDNIKFEINSYDTYALEEALKLKDAGEAEVVAVSVGPDRVTQALRTALGMGADRAIHVKDEGLAGSDSLAIAKILASVAKEESPDLVLMGLMSDDGNFSAVPPMLAELVGVPSATSVLKTDISNGTLTVERELEAKGMTKAAGEDAEPVHLWLHLGAGPDGWRVVAATHEEAPAQAYYQAVETK